MAIKNTYKFYFQLDPKEGVDSSIKDLEKDFNGCIYSKCEGLSAYGDIKNIVIEDYAEAEEPRVYIPQTITRETTDVVFTLYFGGENRRDVYDSFVEYVSGKTFKYWDNCRNREVHLLSKDGPYPEEDILYSGSPYIMGKFKFKNLGGKSLKKA